MSPNPTCTATRHGNLNAYTHYRCRCPEAIAARSRQERRWRRRRAELGPLWIDSTGTTRRLQALAALGHRCRDLADALGGNVVHVRGIMRGDQTHVHIDTAHAITAVYDRLSMTIGPSSIARYRAFEKDWAPPLAWDDDAIDNPAALPNYGSPVSRQQALYEDSEELLAQGYTLSQVAERIGVVRRYLENARARHQAELAVEAAEEAARKAAKETTHTAAQERTAA